MSQPVTINSKALAYFNFLFVKRLLIGLREHSALFLLPTHVGAASIPCNNPVDFAFFTGTVLHIGLVDSDTETIFTLVIARRKVSPGAQLIEVVQRGLRGGDFNLQRIHLSGIRQCKSDDTVNRTQQATPNSCVIIPGRASLATRRPLMR